VHIGGAEMAIPGKREKVEHFCFFFNLDDRPQREAYSKKLTEIYNEPKIKNLSVKEYIKKHKEGGPDGFMELDQVWKMIEYDFMPDANKKPYIEKSSLDESIP
jgi:hypothetical protein